MSKNQSQRLVTYVALGVGAILAVVGLALLLRKRKPRSGDDPTGALKDGDEIFADKGQEATEEALARLQETLDEIREHISEINRKRRREVNQRLADLSDQALELLKDLRANAAFRN